jgi:hypothetical protein
MQLFSNGIDSFTEECRRLLKRWISEVPCSEISSLDDKQIDERFLANLMLLAPSIDKTPSRKELSADGDWGEYYHPITNGRSLQYKPRNFAFGGYPHRIDLSGDELVISVQADGNPEPKVRHAQVLEQIQTNLNALAGDVQRHNGQMQSAVAAYIKQRRDECDELQRRRDAL